MSELLMYFAGYKPRPKVYLVTHGQPKKNAPVDAAQAAQLTDSEV